MNKTIKNVGSLIHLFGQLIPFVKPYRNMIIGTLVLTLLGALAAQVNPLLVKYAVDQVDKLLILHDPLSKGLHLLILIALILLGNEMLNVFIQFGQKYYGEKIRINVGGDLAQVAIERILTFRMDFYSDPDHQSGLLQTRISRGVESLTKLVQNFFLDILPLFSTAIIALVIMYLANIYVGLTATIVLPVYFYVSQYQANKLQGVRRKLRGQREEKNNGLLNIILSIAVIKSFVREKLEGKKQLDLQMKMLNNQFETRRMSYYFDGIKSFLEQIGVVLVILLTVYLVLDRQMSIGAIMLHIMLFRNVSAPIRQLHRIYDEVYDAFVYAEGYFEVLTDEQAVEKSGVVILHDTRGTIEVRNVDFTYPNGKKALHNISLTLENDKTTALVGLSGAGKSTLINLLCKFYEPDCGEIFLDRVNLKDYENTSLRRNIGLVLQKNHIFKGSVYDNILYGDIKAAREQVIDSAKKAFLHDQVMGLPDGYNTDAQLLSGGQQQRIAIARLFLKNPPIIFLDEPTASLDAIAVEQIKSGLDAIKQNRTVVIISHSLSQIIDADKIYVLEEGWIVESGTHETLYKQKGTYRKIFDASARSLNLDKIIETCQ